MKRLGGQSDGRELRDDLNSKKDAILADIQFMKSTLQITKKRCAARGPVAIGSSCVSHNALPHKCMPDVKHAGVGRTVLHARVSGGQPGGA